MWFQRFRFSLAQLLVVVSLVSVLCSCAVTLRQNLCVRVPLQHPRRADFARRGHRRTCPDRRRTVVCSPLRRPERAVPLARGAGRRRGRRVQTFEGLQHVGRPLRRLGGSNLARWRPASAVAHAHRPSFSALEQGSVGSRRSRRTERGRRDLYAFVGTKAAVFEVATGRQLRVLNAPTEIYDIGITSDGTRIAARCGGDGGMVVWDTATGQRAAVLDRPSPTLPRRAVCRQRGCSGLGVRRRDRVRGPVPYRRGGHGGPYIGLSSPRHHVVLRRLPSHSGASVAAGLRLPPSCRRL